MDFDDVIRARRSVRRFTEDRVDADTLCKLIEAGVQAPSACNLQGWRFRVLGEEEQRRMVGLGAASVVERAPLAVVVLYPRSSDAYHDEIQSAAACIQNMLLKATELGLGGCWVCHLPAKWRLRRLLAIPFHYDISACVVFGYPQHEPRPVPRRSTYQELFELERPRVTWRAVAKFLYVRQPFRPAFIERRFTRRFEN